MFTGRHYLEVPAWRRAYVALGIVRSALEMPANKQWKNYPVKDYKFHVRFLKRYIEYDRIICHCSTSFAKLDRDVKSPKVTLKAKKRKRLYSFAPETRTESSEPPCTEFTFDLTKDSTTSDEEESLVNSDDGGWGPADEPAAVAETKKKAVAETKKKAIAEAKKKAVAEAKKKAEETNVNALAAAAAAAAAAAGATSAVVTSTNDQHKL